MDNRAMLTTTMKRESQGALKKFKYLKIKSYPRENSNRKRPMLETIFRILYK